MSDLYLDCFSGVAGDMLVGALLDLGASFEAVETGLAKLGVSGYRLERRAVRRQAIAATKFDVVLDAAPAGDPGAFAGGAARDPDHEHHHAHDRHAPASSHSAEDEHHHAHDRGAHERPHGHSHGHDAGHVHGPARGLREIEGLLDSADLPLRVRERARAAFRLLAEAEGRVHGLPAAEVHFHEVGAVDAICDIVGAALALEELGVERIFVGPVRTGSGFVRCAHGNMPVPAPGTLGCLTGFDVRFEEGRGELVTPTGACLLGALATPRAPGAFRVDRVGYGAGTRDPVEVPNVLRAVLGEAPEPGDAEAVVELSTNLDHLAPTVLEAAVERCFGAGALDVFVVPCTMKKGRAGHLLVALAPESARAAVEEAIFAETGTLGIRRHAVSRTVLPREFETAATPWGEVRVKVGRHRGVVTSRVPEFEDCRTLAQRHGIPVAEVIAAATSR